MYKRKCPGDRIVIFIIDSLIPIFIINILIFILNFVDFIFVCTTLVGSSVLPTETRSHVQKRYAGVVPFLDLVNRKVCMR